MSFASAIAARQAAPPNRAMITASIMTATVMIVLDTTIANVALPHMQGSLNASQDQVTWILTSYIVASAILTPLTGWLSGRLGRKNLFLISVAGFTIASALCGVATSITEIVLFRLLQGVFGAPMLPLSQSVLLDINPREKHGQAMAIYGMGVMVGPILGPVVGGWLTEAYSWRWCFFINVPVGILAMTGILLFIHGEKHDDPPKLDLAGFLLLSLGLGALQMMLDRGQGQDWFNSTEIWVEAALAFLGFWWAGVHMATTRRPFINRTLFKDRNFIVASVLGFFLGVMLYSTMALLPPLMQRLMGYPALQSGLTMAPRGFGTLVIMFLIGRVIGKVDTRLLLFSGFILSAYSAWRMSQFAPGMNGTPIVISGLIQGAAMGMLFVPLSTIAFATMPPHLRTDASGLFTLIRNIGSAVGISIISASQMNNIAAARTSLVDKISPGNTAVQLLPPQLASLSQSALAQLDAVVGGQAAFIGYVDAFYMTALLSLGCVPLLLLLRAPKRPPSGGPQEAPHAVMD